MNNIIRFEGMKKDLLSAIIINGGHIDYEFLNEWLHSVRNGELTMAFGLLSRSTIIKKADGTTKIVLPTAEQVLPTLHLIAGAIYEHKVTIRLYDPLNGYILMNLFNGDIKNLGHKNKGLDWYE